MALPPTQLTTLLARDAGNPQGMVRSLGGQGFLVSSAADAQRDTIALIDRVITAAESRPPHPGPTTIDLVAQALVNEGHLSPDGLRAAQSPPGLAPPAAGWGVSLFLFAYGLKQLSAQVAGFTYPGERPFDLCLLQTLSVGLIFLTSAVIPTRWAGRSWLLRATGIMNAVTEIVWLAVLPDHRRTIAVIVLALSLAVMGIGLTWFLARRLQLREFAG